MGKPVMKKYEYKVFTKEPVLPETEELNKLGKDGWLVVACPRSNTYLLVREK